MKININLVGKITQHKLIQLEGKKSFLDVKIDVVLPTGSGKKYTHWVTCKVWHPLADEIEPLLSKDCMVEVSGRPEVKPYLRRDGSAGAEFVVHADEFEVLSEATTEEAEEN